MITTNNSPSQDSYHPDDQDSYHPDDLFQSRQLSNVIMLVGKMLQSEVRLLYEANRRALRTKGMVIFSFVPIVSSIGQVLAKCRPSVGQVLVNYGPSVGDLKS